jgi:hypothetical protein
MVGDKEKVVGPVLLVEEKEEGALQCVPLTSLEECCRGSGLVTSTLRTLAWECCVKPLETS